MANPNALLSPLAARSPFTGFQAFKSRDLAIDERSDLTIASVAMRTGQDQALAEALRSSYGVSLPTTPQRVESNGIAFVWAGHGVWFAVAERAGGRDLELELKPKLAGIASVTDQSDSRAVLRISGKAARETLAKGLPIDLHPRAFKSGDVAITHASHIGVMIWQLDDLPTYEIAMFRSFADSFWHWLQDAAASTTTQ